jgi:hypothetical protein
VANLSLSHSADSSVVVLDGQAYKALPARAMGRAGQAEALDAAKLVEGTAAV